MVPPRWMSEVLGTVTDRLKEPNSDMASSVACDVALFGNVKMMVDDLMTFYCK